MQPILARAARLIVDDEAQDLVEYGLLATLIAIVAMAAVTTLGGTIKTVFWDVIALGF